MLHSLEDFSQFLYCSSDPVQRMKNQRQLLRLADPGYRAHLYFARTIPKHNGQTRLLSIPARPLKRVQHRILHLLEESAVLAPLIAPCAFAYRKRVPLIAGAAPHQGHSTLIRLDLKDFFGSIRFSQVFQAIDRALRSSPTIGPHFLNAHDRCAPNSTGNYNSVLSFYFTQFCTLKGALPQGAPTSPMLSNLVFTPADIELLNYCTEHHITYTRYSDDLFFSGDSLDPGELIFHAKRCLRRHGFFLNSQKISVCSSGKRHFVTGITVNSVPQASREYRRSIRQEIHMIRTYGLDDHLIHCASLQQKKETPPDPIQYLNRLTGRVSFVLQVNPNDSEFLQYRQFLSELRRALSGRDSVSPAKP